MEGDAVEGTVVCVSRYEVLHALNETSNSSWSFRCIIGVDCCRKGVRINVKAEICQNSRCIWNASWSLSIVVQILTRKVDTTNCSFSRAVNLLEHGMVVERVLEKNAS